MSPPSLSHLIEHLADPQGFVEFVSVVRLFTPDYEAEILREPEPAVQIAMFAQRFETAYFPLHHAFASEEMESYADLVACIPIIPLGYGYEEYEEIPQAKPGIRLMSYLISAPDAEGSRLVIGESCLELVPSSLLQKVPEHGFKPEELHGLLDGTKSEALALWADILHQDSTYFLSLPPEALYEGWDTADWNMETVQALTQEWHESERIMDQINELSDWLGKKPASRFRHLLNFALERRKAVGEVNSVNNA